MVPNALRLHRAARRLRSLGIPLLPGLLTTVGVYLHRAWLHCEAELGEEVELGYGGLGLAIAPGVRVGRGTFISQHVTLGERPDAPGVPRLGRNVMVGAGARVLGPVTVGDDAVIGANAVVLEDVAPGAVVAGIPARELHRPAPTGTRQAGAGVSPGIAAHPDGAHLRSASAPSGSDGTA
jgi:serine O-acetyltransferase